MNKKKGLICIIALSLMTLLPFVVSAQTTITASVVLNQTVLDGYTWPITIQGGTIDNPVVVKLTENITLTDASHYLVIGSDYVTFDGNNKTITINGVGTYLGLIRNGSSIDPVNGYSNITIKNIKLSTTTDQLIDNGGWIGQDGFGYNATNVTIDNCHTSYPTANVGNGSGGIVGRYSPASITNCSSAGPVGNYGGGGICGKYFSGTAVNCHSAGDINLSAGGIIGSLSSGTAINCYSTGNIIGLGSGGIMGSAAGDTASATNCYSRGAIGNDAGGIMAQKSKGKVTNCYSTGTITGTRAGGIVGYLSSGTITNCYTLASTIMGSNSTSLTDKCYASDGPWSDIFASSVLTGTDGTVWKGYGDGVEEPFTLASITPFVTTWQTDGSLTVTIPLAGSGYDFTIDWGNGTIESKADPINSVTHTYTVAGIKTVSIRPNIVTGFPLLYMANFSNASLLKTIESWGSGKWGASLRSSFSGASNLVIKATDIPDFSNVTDMSYMFNGATAFNQDISNWNVSNVIDMSAMFNGATAFNQDINNWNVSTVTNMSYMFNAANAFNQDISNWNVSNVNDMGSMFRSATAFNQNIGNWNVSNVTSMSAMFNGASTFDQDIKNWNVSNVTSMRSMFNGATVFNQDISNWNVSNVTSMSSMFNGATAFNQNIGNWDVSNVTSMSSMFNWATAFNQNIGNWDVSKVIIMSSMFNGATAFNQNIGNWNVSNVTNMSSMFNGATAFNQNIAGWDILKISSMSSFLSNARLSRANYDALLVGWSENGIPINISASFGSSKYSNIPATISARSVLTSSKSWMITDGGIQNDLTLPTITNSSLSSDNSAITVTFSEAVYPTFRGTGTLATTGFEFAITGGAATLSSTTPTRISTTDNLTFVLGIGLNGTANGSEVVTINPLVNSIFDLAENEASTTQTNNTVQLNNLNPVVAPTISDFNPITKYYFNRSTTITDPTSNSTGIFSYTSDNTNVATIQGNTITFTGVGTANITATQAADANYEGNAISTLLTILGKDLVSKYGGVSNTDTNYVDANGNIGGAFGLDKYGKKVEVSGGIITSGLVMHLDAGNTASYPGTGTAWKDLSGNGNHGILKNGVTFNSANYGSLVFDGINDYFVTDNNLSMSDTDKLTIQVILKTASTKEEMIIEHSVNFNVNNSVGMVAIGNKMEFTDANPPGYNIYGSVSTINNNNWHLLSATTDRSLGATDQTTIYIDNNAPNKVNVRGFNNNNSGNFTNHKLYISSRAGANLFFNGGIAQVLVYNRALTAAEIQQNYNAIKSRYGL
jgi:surface protein